MCSWVYFILTTYLELCMKERAAIEFRVVEGETPVNIHKRLQGVYKNEALGLE